MDIGERVRQLRKFQKLTIRDLADRVGVTSSMISQIERNTCNPSLSLLRKVAEALDTPIWMLLYDESAEYNLIRKEKRNIIAIGEGGLLKQAYLTPHRKQFNGHDHQLEVIYDEWGPGVDGGFQQHYFEEEIFILSGQLEATIADKIHILNEGDCLFYLSETPHKLRTVGKTTVKFLTIITPPEF